MIRINFDINVERAASGYESLIVGSYSKGGGGAGEARCATWNLSIRNICPKTEENHRDAVGR
jgi:hypothetical protein